MTVEGRTIVISQRRPWWTAYLGFTAMLVVIAAVSILTGVAAEVNFAFRVVATIWFGATAPRVFADWWTRRHIRLELDRFLRNP